MGVVAEVDAAKQGSLFAQGGQFLLFGGARQKDGCVVAEDAGENLFHSFSAWHGGFIRVGIP